MVCRHHVRIAISEDEAEHVEKLISRIGGCTMFDVEVICAWIFHRASAPVQPHSYKEVRWK